MIIMAAKKTGIYDDFIIHPGETIADILEERGISQSELALTTGVTPAYVSNVISGKKDISARFAQALEYALDVPKTFWLNLQANYDAEVLAYIEKQTITPEELQILPELKDVLEYMSQIVPRNDLSTPENSILFLRRALRISNLGNLKNITTSGLYHAYPAASVNPSILGAWVRICQISDEQQFAHEGFQYRKLFELTQKLKDLAFQDISVPVENLIQLLENYGILLSLKSAFPGAPVLGFVSRRGNNSYQMVIAVPPVHKDAFWHALFHELGHIANGDLGKSNRYLDTGTDKEKEKAADQFAKMHLVNKCDYEFFISENKFSYEAISAFASSQRIQPYLVHYLLHKDGITTSDS